MAAKEFAVRLGHGEISRILNLKDTVEHNGLWQQQVARYQSLGWFLEAMNARDNTLLAVDFFQPQEAWAQRLAELGMEGIQVNVGIRTGRPSRLLVLEVNKGEGALSLDRLGEWRAECLAALRDLREQYYYVLPPERPAPASCFLAPQVLIFGEGGRVLAPPSLEPQAREPWRWLRPPWESPPRYPKAAVWRFLKEHSDSVQEEPEVLSWEEVYRLIAHHGAVLKALLSPPASLEDYYRGILRTATGVGIKDPRVLAALLWHAPHGESGSQPGRWEYMQELAAREGESGKGPRPPAPESGAASAVPGNWPAAGKPLGDMTPAFPADGFPLAPPGYELGGEAPGPGCEPGAGSFDRSVSRQFFQLLAGLGEKVIAGSLQHEALMKAGGMKGMAEAWNRRFCPPHPQAAEFEPAPAHHEVAQAWNSMIEHLPQKQPWQETQIAAQDFLVQNPDLAADPHKALMVIFCLKNYIAINPEFTGLLFREKLEKAGNMARVFLRA